MRHHRITTAAVAAVAALTLAACGSSSSTTTADCPDAQPLRSSTPAATTGTIVDVAAANPDFTTLVAAVKAADLVDTLSGDGPFTVFAPTNAAFEALPAGLLDKLLLPENKETLTKILTYHVLGSKVMAADVMRRLGPHGRGQQHHHQHRRRREGRRRHRHRHRRRGLQRRHPRDRRGAGPRRRRRQQALARARRGPLPAQGPGLVARRFSGRSGAWVTGSRSSISHSWP